MRLPSTMHGACTTLTVVAPFFRASQMQVLAQRVQQRGAIVDLETRAFPLTVNDTLDGSGHVISCRLSYCST